MKRSYKLRIALLIFSLFLIFETTRLGLSYIFFSNRDVDSMERGLALNPSDAESNFNLAEFYRLFMLENEKAAEALYVKSIEENPLFSSPWLSLTEAFIDDGENEKASVTLNRAKEVAPFYIARLWQSSILAFRLGDEAMAVEGLKIIVKTDPGRRAKVFDICWQLIDSPELILNEIVTDDALPSYLGYLIVKDKLRETFPVWKRMKRKGLVSDDTALLYTDFLIGKGRISQAFSIWSDTLERGGGDSLISNGGFESASLGRGFDWKVLNAPGVTVDFDWGKSSKGSYSLKLEFDGRHNVDFSHVFQIVPVEPNTDYVLTSYISTLNITTRNGIGWEVYCYPVPVGVRATETITGTTDWERSELPFRTPPRCTSVVVRLRRYKSEKLDRYISGAAWVDDVRLFKAGVNRNAQSGKKGV